MGTSCSTSRVDEECDVLIIGAGFGGAYAAHLLKQHAPSLKVVVVEQTGRIGGRLHSTDSDGDGASDHHDEANKDELGGMRIFPSAGMEKVAALVKNAGLTLTPVPLGDDDNLFEYNGVTVRKGDARSPSSGRSYSEINKAAFADYSAKHNANGDVDPYSCPVLREISVPTYLKRFGAADDAEVEWWVAYSGYDLYPEEVQASIFVKDGELYGSGLTDDQRYVKEGFMELVKRLLAGSSAELCCNTTVINIQPGNKQKDSTCLVACETLAPPPAPKTGASKTTAAAASPPTRVVFRAKRVLVSVAANQAAAFNKGTGLPVSKTRKAMMQGSVSLPLFKCFLQWDDDAVWWGQHHRLPSGAKSPFLHGKSTTNGRCRQVHYYDQEDLLIYNSNQHARYWNEQFLNDPAKAARDMFESVRSLHSHVTVSSVDGAGGAMKLAEDTALSSTLPPGELTSTISEETIPEPDFAKTLHRYWPSGSHKWRVGADVPASIATIPDGKADGSNIYVAGDAFSAYQGWVLGAVQTVDAAVPLLLDGLPTSIEF